MGNLTQLQQIGLGSAGVGVAGAAMSGFGQYESGQQQKAADDYNAAITLQQMRQKMQTTEDSYAALTGRQAALYAKAGVDVASGSPLLIMTHTAAQGGVEQASEAEAGTEQSNLLKYQGKVAAFTGTVGGIDTFLQGLAKGLASTSSILGPGGSSGVPTVPNSMFPY